MPIDPLPTPNGNIVLLDDGHSFRVLTKVALDIYKQSGGEVHISHFATCVCADDFRPKKAA